MSEENKSGRTAAITVPASATTLEVSYQRVAGPT